MKYKFILLLMVFFVFCYFRFYNLDKRISFGWDQERDAYQIRDLIINHKLTLIGPRVVGPEGFFLAPYYTYLLTPFYLISNLHPIGSSYLLIIYNLLFFFTAYYVIKKILTSCVQVIEHCT